MNDADRANEFWNVERHRGEDPVFNFARDAGLGQDADAGIDGNGLLYRFYVVKLHCRIDLRAMLPQRFVNGFTNRQVLFEGNESLVLQLLCGDKALFRQRVSAMADE